MVKTQPEREWYIRQTVQSGWSRNVLVLQIESGLYRRQGKAQTNFSATLPAPQSDLVQQVLKDPYNFDFLMLAEDARERELESGLLEHLRKFLLELGVGFAFVGSQYPLEVGGEDFRIDLLFYHLLKRGTRPSGALRLLDNPSIPHVHDVVRVGRGFGVVRDHEDGLAEALVQAA